MNLIAAGRHPYVVGPYKQLRFGDAMLEAGDPVPGAENWTRLDAWLRARVIAPA